MLVGGKVEIVGYCLQIGLLKQKNMFVAEAGARRSCCHAKRRLCYVVVVGSAGRAQRMPLGAWHA
ncbi:hypothetical protein A2U01_0084535, partial [Trifolium medium]|nr:hypothetical protein [Trifolium medium]